MRWPFAGNDEGAAIPDDSNSPPEISFAFRLFRELARQNSSSSIFFSPCSVMLSLAMVYEGATGETRSEMASGLQLSGLDTAGVATVVARLRSILQGNVDVELLIANSLWCNKSIPVDPAFSARIHEEYGAEVREVDFAAASAAAQINAWVSEKTAGKIPHMVDCLDPLTLLVALNAIYFKGRWQQPFHKSLTKDQIFTTGSGIQKTLPRMLKGGKVPYFATSDFQAVALPYQGSRVAMYVFLPAAKSSLTKFQAMLSAAEWGNWMKQFVLMGGWLHLPRFKMNYQARLRDALAGLGMARAFDPKRAEFAGIRSGPPPIWIDNVLHHAVAEVNEEGTEAAAATATLMGGMAARRETPEPTFEMIVDRPFLFVIRDQASGNILFMGSVVDPTS